MPETGWLTIFMMIKWLSICLSW